MINAYTIMMAIIVFLGFIMKGYNPDKKIYTVISCAIMFVIIGLRNVYIVGNDSASSYYHNFLEMEYVQWYDIKAIPYDDNPAMSALMKLVYIIFGGDYQWFIIIVSLFIMIVLAHFITKYSCNPLQSIIYYWGLLFYSFMFDALKQAIAMSIILLAFDQIMNKKFIRFLLLIFLAAMFHFPAIVFLPAYFIAKMRIDKYYLVLLGGLLTVTYIFRDKLLLLMNDVYETTIAEEATIGFFATKVIIMLVIVVAGVILRPPSEDDELYCKMLAFVGISIAFQTFAGYNNTFERLADYYFQFAIILIPLIFEKIELKKNLIPLELQSPVKTFAPIIFCSFGIWRFANTVMNNPCLFPYHFMKF